MTLSAVKHSFFGNFLKCAKEEYAQDLALFRGELKVRKCSICATVEDLDSLLTGGRINHQIDQQLRY